MSDFIGIVVLACEVALLAVFRPVEATSYWIWLLPFLMLSVASLFVWHGARKIQSYLDCLMFIGVTLAGAFALFVIDIAYAYLSHPELPVIDAAKTLGGTWGYILTLLMCPGMTMVGIATLARLLWIKKVEGSR